VSDGRILVVTVGTSLFSSASWAYEGELKSICGYRAWVGEYLEDPDGRRKQGPRTVEDLKKLLKDQGTAITSTYFAEDFDCPLRYSGELATLLRCSQRFGKGDESFAEFLRRSYREIQLLASTNENNKSHLAADHLEIILRDKAGHPNVTRPGSLRSSYLHELLDFLRDHLTQLSRQEAEADLLVTGGYKAYSLLAGKFVASQPKDHRWRALYIHEEDAGQLIVEGRGDTSVGEEKVVRTRWPSPVGED
jgi:hypothetical protein